MTSRPATPRAPDARTSRPRRTASSVGGFRIARGIALLDGGGAALAQIAEVSVGEGGRIEVHRVVCAIDCGVAVNPDGVRAQVEGGIAFGLSAALHGEITIANGAAAQSNFHDYPLLAMAEMPDVDVHIVPSDAPPDGVGEPPVPPIASAVANALFTITGKRIRRLPFGDHGAPAK